MHTGKKKKKNRSNNENNELGVCYWERTRYINVLRTDAGAGPSKQLLAFILCTYQYVADGK